MTILITGCNGLVGNALKSCLSDQSYLAPSSKDLNLLEPQAVNQYFENNNIDLVFHLAAKVGGVKANSDGLGVFFYENITMNTNLLEACRKHNVNKVVSMLSTCVYPDALYVSYPLTEDQLHNGPPHDSNFGYAYAKRMLDVQSRAYRKQYKSNFVTVIPNNLFGEHDNFHLENSHVIPALIRKIWEAKINNVPTVEVWGDGSPLREFTYSKDVARILLTVANEYNQEHPINIGNTEQYSIAYVAYKIVEYLEYQGKLVFNTSKPSGQYQKPSCNKKFLTKTTWKKQNYTSFDISLKQTCEWFKNVYPNIRS